MSELEHDAHQALDEYIEYMTYDGDEIGNEDRRFQFMDAAVALLEKLTGRNVSDEIN